MICSKCKHSETQVIDSRDCPDGVRRRRECLQCKHRFTTYERTEFPVVIITKKSGDQERFDPEKIRKGVQLSCKNRPVTSIQIDALTQEVEQRVYLTGKEEVSSREIGVLVQELLHELDEVAYVRFTSVYQAFTSVREFTEEIHNIN